MINAYCIHKSCETFVCVHGVWWMFCAIILHVCLVLPVFCKAIICTYISCNCLTNTLFYTMVNFYKLDCQTFNQFNIVCNWKQIELKFYLVKVFHMPFNKRWCKVFWAVSLTFLNPLLNYQTILYKDSYFIIYDWVRIY